MRNPTTRNPQPNTPIMKRIAKHLFIVMLLTIFTQVGGIIWLLCVPIFNWVNRKNSSSIQKKLIKTTAFLSIYLLLCWTLVPAFAKYGGRVALPTKYSTAFPVAPANKLFCWMNRHYVSPKMKTSLQEIALNMQEKYPDTRLQYLDANFPFLKGFPLLPHLSHNDGRKLDIAFLYQDTKTGKPINGRRISFTGYGVCEEARKGEYNQVAACAKQGGKMYSMMKKITPQNRKGMSLDEKRTTELLRNLTQHQSVTRLFIEPHLKTRLGLSGEKKIRFHGCHAVRHDDHIHIEVK